MSIRTERVASVIKERVAAILIHDYSNPAYGFITVTDVKMTPDLKIARVYFSVFGSEEIKAKAMKMLEGEKQHIRGLVASYVRLKFAPALQFHLDQTLEEADKINRLINKIHEDDKKPPHDTE
jgi:ribosome-binding factor A